MVQRRASTERLGYFSDAVFALIITIMVLELLSFAGLPAARAFGDWQ